MSRITRCSNSLFTRTRKLLKTSRNKNAPSNPSITGASFPASPFPITSSIAYCVSFGYADAHASDNNAHPIVAAAISLYGRRYTATRRNTSHVVRDFATNDGSAGPDNCG